MSPKTSLKRKFIRVVLLGKLPEMRLFWFLLPFLVAILVINTIYLPDPWRIVSLGVIAVLGLVIAVTNLRLAKSNLEVKVERNELKSIIANLRDGVIAYSQNFRIVIFNHAAEQIFSLAAKEMIGQIFTLERARDPRFQLMAQVIFPSLAPTVFKRSDPGTYPQIVDLSFEKPTSSELIIIKIPKTSFKILALNNLKTSPSLKKNSRNFKI